MRACRPGGFGSEIVTNSGVGLQQTVTSVAQAKVLSIILFVGPVTLDL